MKPKYEMIEDYIDHKGRSLRQICALKDIPALGLHKGDLGGYLESENNLSQKGKCWVAEGGYVYDGAVIHENALVAGNARVYGNASMCEDSVALRNAKIYGHAMIFGEAQIGGKARVHGQARVGSAVHLGKKDNIGGQAWVSDACPTDKEVQKHK